MTGSQFTCAQQIKSALEMQPTGMYRGDLYDKCKYPGKHDAHFGAVLNALVQASDVIDHMEEGGKHRYFSPKAYVPVASKAQAAAPEAKPVRIILTEERRRIMVERIRACGHPVTVNHVYDFGLHTQKPVIYPDLKQLVDDEVLERKDLPGDERLLQAHWWFRGETWPELVKHAPAEAPAPLPQESAPAPTGDLAQPLAELTRVLMEGRTNAQTAIDAYMASVIDPKVMAVLRRNLASAEKALAAHLTGGAP